MNNLPSLTILEKSVSFVPLTRHPSDEKNHAEEVLSEMEGDYGLACPDYILVNQDDCFGILIPFGEQDRFAELIKMYEESVSEWED